ncbi:MAG: Gfo/Idh/MocA family oxidoreductase [Pirellulaceae bacterium]
MARGTTRRRFMQTTAAAGVGYWVAGGVQAQESKSAIEEIRFACIGVGGKGQSDSADAGRNGAVVAICDIDDNTRLRASAKFSKAKPYYDYRKMLDEMGKSIDAVTVSTPDHHHAPAAVRAMRMGINCFCQKPMTHSIGEARLLGNLAAENKLATQMGNQGTADPTLRASAALVQRGDIGTVKEVHIWTNRPVWPQGLERPAAEEVPAHVHWDEWLGPAPERPYSSQYHPFKWRGWWDFGTGALGDMACHTLNMPYMALELKDPISVQAETAGHDKDSYPKWSVINYEFAANDNRPAVKMIWYDGGKKPPIELLPTKEQLGITDDKRYNAKIERGSLLIGEKGSLFSPGDYGGDSSTGVLAGGEYTLQNSLDIEFERSPGHFEEFARAIKGGPAARSNFPGYATGLTEVVLLGNLAVWADGPKVEWDAKNLKCTNMPELQKIVNKEYRQGWGIDA